MMIKKYLTLTLSFLVLNLSLSSVAFAQTKAEKEAKFADKVKAKVTKLGTGEDARVEVKLKDGTKLKGYVSEINDNSFVVVNEKSGAVTEIPYPQTKQVKGYNPANKVLVAIGIGFIPVFFIIIWVAGNSD